MKTACLLSEYKIDEEDKNMKSIINKFYELEKEKKYYYALYTLQDLILQDGTSEIFNNIYLNFILDHYDEIMETIKNIKNSLLLDEKEETEFANAINNAKIYNFSYIRDKFDKLEVSLNIKKLEIIKKKKMKHNLKIIKKYPELKIEYNGLFSDEKDTKKISPDTIYETINCLNLKISDESKLFYIYDYLDVKTIENYQIFEYLKKDKLYLNQFSFGFFDQLGIPIGYSGNINIRYRYLFLLLKNKINELVEKNKKLKKNDASIEFVFETFQNIFSIIKDNKYEFLKYFALLFAYVIFKDSINIANIYQNKAELKLSYFNILCEQFSIMNTTNEDILNFYEKDQKEKIKLFKDRSEIPYKGKNIVLNNKDYSLNSFLINVLKGLKQKDEIILKNASKKFLCQDKIYEEYYDDFIVLLKKICCSNIAKIMQSLHSEFNEYKTFYSDNKIKEDLFENRLKFYPYEGEETYGITDKYLLEIYMSSIYLNNITTPIDWTSPSFKIILYIFNMGFHSVTFQHEALNHFVRAYLFYFNDDSTRKISIDTETAHNYYPKQNFEGITEPLYLKKFLSKLNEDELKELSNISTLDYNKYLTQNKDKDSQELKETTDEEVECDDEGYYYERQLFTEKDEKKLQTFNLLQAIMLIDEDAYNLDPVHFHFCFLELKDTSKYQLIKDNFNSKLLKGLFKDLNIEITKKILDSKFIAKRSFSEGEMPVVHIERGFDDALSLYAKNK